MPKKEAPTQVSASAIGRYSSCPGAFRLEWEARRLAEERVGKDWPGREKQSRVREVLARIPVGAPIRKQLRALDESDLSRSDRLYAAWAIQRRAEVIGEVAKLVGKSSGGKAKSVKTMLAPERLAESFDGVRVSARPDVLVILEGAGAQRVGVLIDYHTFADGPSDESAADPRIEAEAAVARRALGLSKVYTTRLEQAKIGQDVVVRSWSKPSLMRFEQRLRARAAEIAAEKDLSLDQAQNAAVAGPHCGGCPAAIGCARLRQSIREGRVREAAARTEVLAASKSDWSQMDFERLRRIYATAVVLLERGSALERAYESGRSFAEASDGNRKPLPGVTFGPSGSPRLRWTIQAAKELYEPLKQFEANLPDELGCANRFGAPSPVAIREAVAESLGIDDQEATAKLLSARRNGLPLFRRSREEPWLELTPELRSETNRAIEEHPASVEPVGASDFSPTAVAQNVALLKSIIDEQSLVDKVRKLAKEELLERQAQREILGDQANVSWRPDSGLVVEPGRERLRLAEGAERIRPDEIFQALLEAGVRVGQERFFSALPPVTPSEALLRAARLAHLEERTIRNALVSAGALELREIRPQMTVANNLLTTVCQGWSPIKPSERGLSRRRRAIIATKSRQARQVDEEEGQSI